MFQIALHGCARQVVWQGSSGALAERMDLQRTAEQCELSEVGCAFEELCPLRVSLCPVLVRIAFKGRVDGAPGSRHSVQRREEA